MTNKTSLSRLSTGNEFVSIPDISTANAGVNNIGFMHSSLRGCIELHGSDECALLKPLVEVDGEELFSSEIDNSLDSYWIPTFKASSSKVEAEYALFAPLDRRGFVSVITVRNTSAGEVKVKAGWHGCWNASYRAANITKMMSGVKHAYKSSWREGVPVLEFRGQVAMFALALVTNDAMPVQFWDHCEDQDNDNFEKGCGSVESCSSVNYDLANEYTLAPSEELSIPVYVGLGTQEVSAIASAQEMKLQGWQRMLAHLRTWLAKHTIESQDKYFKHLMNVNSFYNYFYSQAITLDTEEFVVTTARSSSNPTCASYWDRDAMRWSLPAVLQINWAQARKMLIYAFTTQLPNVGVHSRFIEGTVLEPGIQLDQLCAPLRALHTYVELTGDMSVLFDRRVQVGVNTIQQILAVQRHSKIALFETLLLPSGEPATYPYVCFSNVLVWRVLHDISRLYGVIRDLDRAEEALRLANKVKDAILQNFIVAGPYGEMFAQAIDLEGGYELGDDPAGSIQLLSHLGFCSADDPIFKRTVAWINTENNPFPDGSCAFSAPMMPGGSGASVIAVVNGLYTARREQSLDFLRRAHLDDLIACESVDPETGRATGGKAFASCAGYMAFGLRLALKAIPPETAVVEQLRRPSETLYQPPPETNQDTKKARL